MASTIGTRQTTICTDKENALRSFRILAVGRIKTSFWQQAAAHYFERLRHNCRVTESIVKDGGASLPPSTRNAEEGSRIISAIGPSDIVVCLDEHGKNRTSRDFATFLEQLTENSTRQPCFIIGGAFGLDKAVLQRADHKMALGPMTYPHELARVLLLEQLYRADAILRGSPYHHD